MSTIRQEVERKVRAFYFEDANISWSFKTLENLAKKLGADLQVNDILVVDNVKKNKRKMYRKTELGGVIVYGSLDKGEFRSLPKISTSTRAGIDYFGYAK